MSPNSPQQLKFLRQQKINHRIVLYLRLLLFFGFLAAWEGSVRLGRLDSFIFSSPSRICKTFWNMCQDHSLFVHIGITLGETLISFLLVLAGSLLIAVILWLSKRTALVLEPYLVILNSLPKSALAPLLIVWLGANIRTIVVAGLSVALFGSIISLYTGFQQVDPDKLKLIATFGGTRYDALCKVVLPSCIPLVLSVMKVNIGLCLVGVVIGEFIGARAGLGYLIIYGSQVFL